MSLSHEVLYGPKADVANWLRKVGKEDLYDGLLESDLDDEAYYALFDIAEDYSNVQQAKRFIISGLVSWSTESLRTRVAWCLGAKKLLAPRTRMTGFSHLDLGTVAHVAETFPQPEWAESAAELVQKAAEHGVELSYALAMAPLIEPFSFETMYKAIEYNVPLEYLHSL